MKSCLSYIIYIVNVVGTLDNIYYIIIDFDEYL